MLGKACEESGRTWALHWQSLACDRAQAIAAQVDGYDAADLRVLLDRAALAAARRDLAEVALATRSHPQYTSASAAAQRRLTAPMQADGQIPAEAKGVLPQPQPSDSHQLRLTADDLSAALRGFTPSAYWGVGKMSAGGSVVQVGLLPLSPCSRAWTSQCKIGAHVIARVCKGFRVLIVNDSACLGQGAMELSLQLSWK